MKLHQTTFPTAPSHPNLPALLQPHNPLALIVFGHGAGTPMRAPLMHHMAEALAHQRIATFRYDYPYSHHLQAGYTEDLIDPLEILLQTTRAATQHARQLAPDLPLFLAGRSMSGQVMSLLLAREPLPHVRGLICYVYPNRWRVLLPDTVAHLPHVPVPMLFIQGARDPEYCDLTHLQSVLDQLGSQSVRGEPVRSPSENRVEPHSPQHPSHPELTSPPIPPLAPHFSSLTPRLPTLHVIKGADHSFTPPPNAERTEHDNITRATHHTATWIRHQLTGPQTAAPHPT